MLNGWKKADICLVFQSAPKVIAELVVTGIKVLGKATAAAGQQAVRSEYPETFTKRL